MRLTIAIAFALGIFVPPALAQDLALRESYVRTLPDKPQARFAGKPGTADRDFWIEAGAMGAAFTLDEVSTAQLLASNPNTMEVGYLAYGSRSMPKIAGEAALVDIGAVVVAYEWKRYVHNKYLHPLWHVPMAFRAVAHAQGAVHNWTFEMPAGEAPVLATTGVVWK